jgi:hypothetical protein
LGSPVAERVRKASEIKRIAKTWTFARQLGVSIGNLQRERAIIRESAVKRAANMRLFTEFDRTSLGS